MDTTSDSLIIDLQQVDWSFPDLTNSGLHSFHWYPATYLAAIPGTLIPYLAPPDGIVLDPFCGSGTTGMEAVRLGRRFVGIDTNPVALLMSEAKLAFADPRHLLKAAASLASRAQGIFREHLIAPQHPRHAELLRWYAPETADILNRQLDAILQLNNKVVRSTLLAVFSAILKSCSSQGKHWGWVCDNVTPKSHEITYKDANAAFENAISEFAKESGQAFHAAQVHSHGITRSEIRQKSMLLGGDCVKRLKTFEEKSVDLIMTSPPYYGVADYVKSQRLSYLWFDRDELAGHQLGFRDFEKLRALEAGARSNRHRTDSHARYVEFMDQFLQQAWRVMKDGAFLVLVVGESSSRASTIDDLLDLASKSKLKLQTRLGRNIKATRRRLMAKVKGEDILVFSK